MTTNREIARKGLTQETHSAGAGCPFLASSRRWRGRLAHHRVNLSRADRSLLGRDR